MTDRVTDCQICRAIPAVADREDPGGLPAECEQLVHHRYDLCRCPLCVTYYSYFYDHDSGGGTSAGGTDEVYRRLTIMETIETIRRVLNDPPFVPRPTLEDDLAWLLRKHPEPAQTVEDSIRCIDQAVLANEMLGNEAAQLAAWSLGQRKVVEAIPALANALARGPIRDYAARALATIGGATLDVLGAACDAGNARAAFALGHLARVEPTLALTIQGRLLARFAVVSPRTYGHEWASKELAAIVWAIGMTGYSEVALAALVDLFGRTYGWEREAAIEAVAHRMGKVALPRVIPLLSSEDSYTVEAAIETLAKMGPQAREALPALEACPMRPRLDWRIDRARPAITAPCSICRDIPDRADYKPFVFSKLESLAGGDEDLLKCPLCATYYEWSHAYFAGAPEYTVDPAEHEALTRRTDAEAIGWIRRALRDRPREVKSTLARELDGLMHMR